MLVPAREEDVGRAARGDRLAGVLALPLARVAAEEDERRPDRRRPARAAEGADQQAGALDRGEAAGGDDDGVAARSAGRSGPRCSGPTPRPPPAASRAGRRRGARASGRRGRPDAARSARGRSRSGPRRSDPRRGRGAPRRAGSGSARGRAGGRRGAPSAASGAPTPRRASTSAAAPSAIRSSMSSSVPCRCATTGTSGATRAAASCTGVRWWRWSTSCVGGARRLERRRPGGDVPLVLVVVHGGEHAVGGVGPVLVGGVHRRVAGGEVDGVDVEARVEALGVAHAAAAERAGDDRDVPAVGGQLLGEGAGHVGRAAAGEEHEGVEDAHPSVVPEM